MEITQKMEPTKNNLKHYNIALEENALWINKLI